MNVERWSRVKEVFHATLEQAPEDRAVFLDDACVGDQALLAEVDRLLNAHAHAGSFIENSPVMAMPEPEDLLATMTGRTVGHYRIGRLLGVGGMGEVYAAHDIELGRAVALKVMTGDDLNAHARLRREAQHASQLNHPHICTIHEVGSSDGQAYIVMEHVEGRPLSELIAGNGLPIETTLRYGIHIADALAHAHRRGVVHRDLKSANVVVTTDGRAKVLDFGLALGLPAPRAQELSQSRAGLATEGPVAGTLPYMAPELLRGEQADARSDIWALGVVLYEMAAGRRPFSGGTGFELSAAIMHSPLAPLPPRVPASLRRVIQRCLAKNPGDRYHEAIDVRSALEPVTVESGATRFVRARAPAVALVALLAMAVASVSIWRWTGSGGTPVAVGAAGRPAIAVMYFDNVAGSEDTAWLSKGIPSMLLTSLAQIRGLDIVSAQRLHETVRQLGQKSLESLDKAQRADVARQAGAGAIVVGSIVKSGSELRIDAQVEDLSGGRVLMAESVRGTDLFTLVDQLAAQIRDGIGFRDATNIRGVADVSSTSLEAYRLYSQGVDAYLSVRPEDAQRVLQQAVAIDPAFAEAYLQLAFVSEFLGRPAARAEYLQKAAEHSDRLGDRQRLLAQADVAREAGHAAEAARRLEALIASFPDFENAYPSLVLLYEPVQGALYDPQKYIMAGAAGVKALPLSPVLRNIYAYALLSDGRYAEATRELDTYARIAPREPNPYDSLGEAHLMMGAPEKAVEYYSRAMTVDPTFSTAHNGRAWGLAMLGRFDEAIAETPRLPSLNAFILSRVGRYRDAGRVIDAGSREAEANKNLVTQGGLHLLSSLLALERKEYARALQEARSAERSFAQLPDEQSRAYRVLVHLLAGMAEVRAGRLGPAQSHLESQRLHYRPAVVAEKWWLHALEGDLALAGGHLQEAERAYVAGQPPGRMWFNMSPSFASILANNLPSRDGVARVMKARGDIAGATQEYRRLTTAGTGQKWAAVLEPRYVLEIARLLDQTGQREAARLEYERFLDLWKHADAELPELTEVRRALERIRQAPRPAPPA